MPGLEGERGAAGLEMSRARAEAGRGAAEQERDAAEASREASSGLARAARAAREKGRQQAERADRAEAACRELREDLQASRAETSAQRARAAEAELSLATAQDVFAGYFAARAGGDARADRGFWPGFARMASAPWAAPEPRAAEGAGLWVVRQSWERRPGGERREAGELCGPTEGGAVGCAGRLAALALRGERGGEALGQVEQLMRHLARGKAAPIDAVVEAARLATRVGANAGSGLRDGALALGLLQLARAAEWGWPGAAGIAALREAAGQLLWLSPLAPLGAMLGDDGRAALDTAFRALEEPREDRLYNAAADVGLVRLPGVGGAVFAFGLSDRSITMFHSSRAEPVLLDFEVRAPRGREDLLLHNVTPRGWAWAYANLTDWEADWV